MLKIDISKMISPRFVTYLLGIIPGLFFESSIAIGNTHFAASLISRVREIYPFGPYSLLIMFFASGLFIGQAFFLAGWIANLLVNFIFGLWRYALRMTLGSNWLYRRFGKWQGLPPKQNVFVRVLGRTVFWARQYNSPFEARPVLKCLHIATKQLLKARYGIDRNFGARDPDNEWNVWCGVLGNPQNVFQDAPIVSRTLLACGLAGFTALYILPSLRERYYFVLTLIFAFAGLIVAVDLAWWRSNPVKRFLVRLQSVFV